MQRAIYIFHRCINKTFKSSFFFPGNKNIHLITPGKEKHLPASDGLELTECPLTFNFEWQISGLLKVEILHFWGHRLCGHSRGLIVSRDDLACNLRLYFCPEVIDKWF